MSEDLITSLYPPPPAYYKVFTEANAEALALCEASAGAPEGQLQFMVPPLPPEGPSYQSFGALWHFEERIPTLAEMGMEQLYPDSHADLLPAERLTAKVAELKKLLKLLLLSFLELIKVLATLPEHFGTKIDNMRAILINMHHLLNEYRPHQSRESLIFLLQTQIDKRKQEVVEIEEACKQVGDRLRKVIWETQDVPVDVDMGEPEVVGEKDVEKERKEIISRLLQSM